MRNEQPERKQHNRQPIWRRPELLAALLAVVTVLIQYPIARLLPLVVDGPWIAPGLHIVSVVEFVLVAVVVGIFARDSWQAVRVSAAYGFTIAVILVLSSSIAGSRPPLAIGPPSWFDNSNGWDLRPGLAPFFVIFATILSVILADILFHLFQPAKSKTSSSSSENVRNQSRIRGLVAFGLVLIGLTSYTLTTPGGLGEILFFGPIALLFLIACFLGLSSLRPRS